RRPRGALVSFGGSADAPPKPPTRRTVIARSGASGAACALFALVIRAYFVWSLLLLVACVGNPVRRGPPTLTEGTMPLSSGEGSGSSGGASGDDGEDPSEAEDQSDAGDEGDATSCDLLARCCEMFASDDPGLGKCRWVSL